tara:strand:- start:750 stop:1352 length:603 start_codon:yes stop_codon:yes gene_type:complete
MSGDGNIGLGYRAGYALQGGDYNIAIGYDADFSGFQDTNSIVIGKSANGRGSNTVALGNSDVTAVYMASDASATVYAAGLNLGGTAVGSTAAELNILDASESNAVSSDGATSSGDFTSNNYKISHTLTLDGNLNQNGILNDITITNSKVLATSVIIANANLKVKIDVHSVVNGSFKVRITNISSSTISDDSDIIINYLVL